jgi:hypothetical protein
MAPYIVITPLCFAFCGLAYKVSEHWRQSPTQELAPIPVLDCGHQSPRNKAGKCIECGREDWREIFGRIPGSRWEKIDQLVTIELRKAGSK